MSYLDRVKACNRFDERNFRPFVVGDHRVGSVKHAFAMALARWPAVFTVTDRAVMLSARLETFELRTEALAAAIETLAREGTIRNLANELYPVTTSTPEAALMLIDRNAAVHFGTRVFGQHVNGFVQRDGELRMWIAKRSLAKVDFPGKLDNLVAGGLPFGRDLKSNLLKECDEEASIPPELASRAVSVGAISHCYECDQGLKPEVIYCYDLELPPDFQPRINDGEVEAFQERSLDEVAAIAANTTDFKMNCDLLVIDFLIRRGYIGPDEPDYLQVITGMRKSVATSGLLY